MLFLLAASLLWAPSFGIIKHTLGGVNPAFVSLSRMVISFLVFAPWCRWMAMDRSLMSRLFALGAVQYGLMYLCYTFSFLYLPAYIVALSTIFTPVYVTLFNDLLARRLHSVFWVCAILAVLGTGTIIWDGSSAETTGSVCGVLLVQASNVCFAAGQLIYGRLMSGRTWRAELHFFAPMYLGAVAVCLPAALVSTRLFGEVCLGRDQVLALAYLGLVPSAIGFFLWNLGAARTSAGVLAVMNNVKIPLAVFAALVVFNEQVRSVPRFMFGVIMIAAALFANEALSKAKNQDAEVRA